MAWKDTNQIIGKRNLFAIVGILLIGVAQIWGFMIVPELKKMSPDYYHYEEQIGTNSIVPQYGAELPVPFEHFNKHEIKVINVVGDNIKISSSLEATNLSTGEVFLSETRLFDIDRNTRSHKSSEQGYVIFPPNTQKHTYFLTFPLAFTHATFTFEGLDIIDGLEVYQFSCKSDPYNISNAIPQFEGYTVLSFYTCKIWVEPLSGRHVNFELDWESYYQEDGKITLLAEKGNKKTSPEFVTKLINQAKTTKIFYQLYDPTIPLILVISGAVTLLLARTIKFDKKDDAEINVKLRSNVAEMEQIVKYTTDEIVKSAKLVTIGQLAVSLSHDLRNPLTVIVNIIRLMQMRNSNNLTVDDKTDYDRIDRAIDKILNQINNIVDFVKLVPPKLSKNSLNEIIDSVIDRMSVPANIKITKPQNDITINCDRIKIESTIMNLILNAIQAIKENGMIAITANESIDHTQISIQDSGLGIEDKNLEHVFEPLFTTKQEGTGLGLAICKNIVEQHGGKITVQNNPTTFTILLPKRK